MDSRTFLALLQLLALTLGFVGASEDEDSDLCGIAKNDPEKTCVSVRLPWQEEPIYFCEDKQKLEYKRISTHCEYCNGQHMNNTGKLLVATPWSCCLLISNPDHCNDFTCPAKPYNRTCTTTPPKENTLECCDQTFCEEGVKSRADCHTKVLESSCQERPTDKTNCIAFIDSYGCCPKFQCQEDAKAGLCPKDKAAQQYNATSVNNSTTYYYPKSDRSLKTTSVTYSRESPDPYSSSDSRFMMSTDYEFKNSLSCIGDYNCPGSLKCCSNDISVYFVGESLAKTHTPTVGYCVDPVKL